MRPATIIGPGGVFERVRDMVRKLPVIPLFYQDRTIQTIWIDDVCTALVRVIENATAGLTIAAHPEAIPLRGFYSAIAAPSDRERPPSALFPAILLWWGPAFSKGWASGRQFHPIIFWGLNTCATVIPAPTFSGWTSSLSVSADHWTSCALSRESTRLQQPVGPMTGWL